MSDEHDEFLVFCTNKGRHERHDIVPLPVDEDSIGWMDRPGFTGPDTMAAAARPGSPVNVAHDSFVFICDQCPRTRTTQMRAEKWNGLVRELRRAGWSSLDISLLPF
jgi:hypothetical protein